MVENLLLHQQFSPKNHTRFLIPICPNTNSRNVQVERRNGSNKLKNIYRPAPGVQRPNLCFKASHGDTLLIFKIIQKVTRTYKSFIILLGQKLGLYHWENARCLLYPAREVICPFQNNITLKSFQHFVSV